MEIGWIIGIAIVAVLYLWIAAGFFGVVTRRLAYPKGRNSDLRDFILWLPRWLRSVVVVLVIFAWPAYLVIYIAVVTVISAVELLILMIKGLFVLFPWLGRRIGRGVTQIKVAISQDASSSG
jgi:hypothetical protein